MTTAKITKLGHGKYEVESFCQEGTAYFVDIAQVSCTCPHFTKRLVGTNTDCKHLTAVRADRFAELTEKARTLPTERLEELKDQYFGQDKAIWLAIDGELHDRAQAQMKQSLRDTQLRALFA